MKRPLVLGALAASLSLLPGACGGELEIVLQPPIELVSEDARVVLTFEPAFDLTIFDASGAQVLSTLDDVDGAYGPAGVTVDHWYETPQLLPGYDGYRADEAPWRHPTRVTLREHDAAHAVVELGGDDATITLTVSLDGPRVRLGLVAAEAKTSDGTPNKTSLAFELPEDEHFFGLGERFATLDHRGWSLYSWAEEGSLPRGEGFGPSYDNPAPNGPSMTYFPVPFFLSSKGYGLHLDTTYRSELHLGSERDDAWRAAVGHTSFEATVYVAHDPLRTLDLYTEDTGRSPVPAQWVFGPRRRVGRDSMVGPDLEWQLMRQRKIPITGMDDAVHFLPALSQTGIEDELAAWTQAAHAAGYKVMAYNNPYVAANHDNAAADYAFGRDHGYFVKGPDGEPALTQFISGQLLEVAAVDLTNPDAVAWFQSLLKRTLDTGYDGWMHDFGEYTARSSTFANGMNGEEGHNLFPVLSAKAAYELMERERPGDYLFFVRSGYAGTQAYVPAVWGGDAEATFDEVQGLPSTVRAGLNLSMTGAPLWGSDMTGFKCLTDDPNDKDVFLRWVEFGALTPIMMEQNACSNPVGMKKEKWKLWNDEETIQHYIRYAGLHTRLQPYFLTLATEAHATGAPITRHPFLLHPDEPATWSIDDSYYLGTALWVSPVVERGATSKNVWMPPGARYVDLTDFALYDGGDTATVDAPLGRLPLFLVSDQILPLLDPTIETLGSSDDPTIVDLADVSDRLDVQVALSPGGTATLALADGTELTATRGADAGNPGSLTQVTAAELPDCASCFFEDTAGALARVRLAGELGTSADLTLGEVAVTQTGGPSRRVRWDILLLP